jgi:hypothetical protein
MKKDYTGIIVQESLIDTSVLDNFIKVSNKIEDSWSIMKVKASSNDITKLKNFIKNGPWYAHFWNTDQLLVVFKDQIISGKDEAIKYGLTIGIPKEQLDFLQE